MTWVAARYCGTTEVKFIFSGRKKYRLLANTKVGEKTLKGAYFIILLTCWPMPWKRDDQLNNLHKFFTFLLISSNPSIIFWMSVSPQTVIIPLIVIAIQKKNGWESLWLWDVAIFSYLVENLKMNSCTVLGTFNPVSSNRNMLYVTVLFNFTAFFTDYLFFSRII